MTPLSSLSESDRAAYEELAAHFEHDADMTRAEAEQAALLFVTSEAYREQERRRAAGFVAARTSHFTNENAVLKK